jgi:hypothetical protein
MNVRFLYLTDLFRSFEHEFFYRISLAFPLVNCIKIFNMTGQEKKRSCEQAGSINTYFHLKKLIFLYPNIDYIKQFLLDTNSHLPNLNELYISYKCLLIVTKNFTNTATRKNCSKVKRIRFTDNKTFVHSRDFYTHFPSM